MRKIIIGIVAVAIWATAIGVYLSRRAADRQAELVEQLQEERRAEARKPQPPPPPPVFGAGHGDFETYFKEKHPLSNKPELLRRLAIREGTPPTTLPGQWTPPGYVAPSADDYDLSKEIFRIYVPEKYDPNVPHGILYYLGYKPTTAMPATWKPILEQSHLIFISPRSSTQPDWQKAAIALDAVHNLKTQYTIDEHRIYLFAFPNLPSQIGQQMSFGLPDVFSGFVNIDRLSHYRPVRVPELNASYNPKLATPLAEMLPLSKSRPRVFVMETAFYAAPGKPNEPLLFENVFRLERFQHVLFIPIDNKEELHYPNFFGPWFSQSLEFLDAQSSATQPSASPNNQ